MNAEIVSRTDWLVFPLISVVLFFAVFVGALLWVYRPGSQVAYAKRSRMVLDDGPVEASGARETTDE